MSTPTPITFDAYHKWLGIPPDEQPATYYRLLGLEPFESDLETIANAADARMAHVRRLQNGRHAAVSQRLLNEISVARACLLEAGKKAAYDAALRTLQAQRERPAAQPGARWLNAPPLPQEALPPSTVKPLPAAVRPPIIVAQPDAGARHTRRRGKTSIGGAGWLVLAIATLAAMIVGMSVGAVAYWLAFRPHDSPLSVAPLAGLVAPDEVESAD